MTATQTPTIEIPICGGQIARTVLRSKLNCSKKQLTKQFDDLADENPAFGKKIEAVRRRWHIPASAVSIFIHYFYGESVKVEVQAKKIVIIF